jgi:hypothetical protein
MPNMSEEEEQSKRSEYQSIPRASQIRITPQTNPVRSNPLLPPELDLDIGKFQ